jgi:hypothetical protein
MGAELPTIGGNWSGQPGAGVELRGTPAAAPKKLKAIKYVLEISLDFFQ